MGLNAAEQMGRLEHLPEKEQVRQACQQFESMLVRQVLKDAMKPMVRGYLSGEGPGSDVYEYFMIDSLANSITEGGGLGIANVLQLQLSPRGRPAEDAQ